MAHLCPSLHIHKISKLIHNASIKDKTQTWPSATVPEWTTPWPQVTVEVIQIHLVLVEAWLSGTNILVVAYIPGIHVAMVTT